MLQFRWTKDTPFCPKGLVIGADSIHSLVSAGVEGYQKIDVLSISDLINDGWLEPVDKPMTKTWETLEANDYVVDGGCTHKVLARINDVVLLSNDKYLGEAWEITPMLGWTHIEELKREGYTIVQPEGEIKYYDGSTSDAIQITTETSGSSSEIPIIESKTKPERKKPQNKINFYFVNYQGRVMKACWNGDTDDELAYIAANCFPDEASALYAAEETRKLWKRLAEK